MINLDAIYPTCLSNTHSVFRDSSRFCFTMVTLCLRQGFNKKGEDLSNEVKTILMISNLAF